MAAEHAGRLAKRLSGPLDTTMLGIVMCLVLLGLGTLYSASYESPGRVSGQIANLTLAFVVMWITAQVPPQTPTPTPTPPRPAPTGSGGPAGTTSANEIRTMLVLLAGGAVLALAGRAAIGRTGRESGS